jgi:hypothetical protein
LKYDVLFISSSSKIVNRNNENLGSTKVVTDMKIGTQKKKSKETAQQQQKYKHSTEKGL